MLKKDYTAKLLNLEDVIITKVENISEEVGQPGFHEKGRFYNKCWGQAKSLAP